MSMVETETEVERAYQRSVHTPTSQEAQELQDLLSRRLTAYISGVKEGRTVTRWINGDVSEIRHESQQRLQTAYAIAQLLSRRASVDVIKAWFIGLNPQLGDVSPAEAIHEGRLQEASAAARSFIAGS